jgi:hypothetical protein
MYHGSDAEFPQATDSEYDEYDTAQMNGGLTEDGKVVLLVYRSSRRSMAKAYIVKETGYTVREPPCNPDAYLLDAGMLSEDSEYLFYTRSGTAFGNNGEARVVEAYSIRHLARIKAETFGFGDGYHIRNGHLLRNLSVSGPIYLAISTSGTERYRERESLLDCIFR